MGLDLRSVGISFPGCWVCFVGDLFVDGWWFFDGLFCWIVGCWWFALRLCDLDSMLVCGLGLVGLPIGTSSFGCGWCGGLVLVIVAWFVACSFGNYCFVWGLDGCGGVVGFRVCFGWVVSVAWCVWLGFVYLWWVVWVGC